MHECRKGHGFYFESLDLGFPRTNRGDWYEIGESQALEIVHKWRGWIVNCEPYNDEGRLQDIWAARYKSFSDKFSQSHFRPQGLG